MLIIKQWRLNENNIFMLFSGVARKQSSSRFSSHLTYTHKKPSKTEGFLFFSGISNIFFVYEKSSVFSKINFN